MQLMRLNTNLLFNVLGVTQCLKLAIEMQAVALLSIFQGTNIALEFCNLLLGGSKRALQLSPV